MPSLLVVKVLAMHRNALIVVGLKGHGKVRVTLLVFLVHLLPYVKLTIFVHRALTVNWSHSMRNLEEGK